MNPISLLQCTFTTNDNQILNDALNQLSLFDNNCDFYQSLFSLMENSSDPNLKLASLIYLKNVVKTKWKIISNEIRTFINNYFYFKILISFDQDFISHIKEFCDVLTEKNLHNLPWNDLLIQYLNSNPISMLLLLRSLIIFSQKYEIHELLKNVIDFVFQSLQNFNNNSSIINLALSVIFRSFHLISFEERHFLFLVDFLSNNLKFKQEFLNKAIKIISKIAIIDGKYLMNIEIPFVLHLTEFLDSPKISILFFHMISNFAQNDALWEPLSTNFINFFIPFFALNDSIDFSDPIGFVSDHFFDSFSSNFDPNSAAFRCLEVIGQYRQQAVFNILSLCKQTYENFQRIIESNKQIKYQINWQNNIFDAEKSIYSASHMASAVLKYCISDDLFDFVFSYFDKSDNILVQCGILIIIQYESYSKPNLLHIKKCVEFLLSQNLLLEYFASNALLKIIPNISDKQSLRFLPIEIIIPKILHIAQTFELPQFTDLLTFLLSDNFLIHRVEPLLPELIKFTFSFAQLYSETYSDSLSISSVFNLIISLIINLKDHSAILSDLCQSTFNCCIQIMKQSILIPVLELLCTAIFYCPITFDQIWSLFPIVIQLLNDMSPAAIDISFNLLSIVLYKDPKGAVERSTYLIDISSLLINQFEINEISLFFGVLIKYKIVPIELIYTLICKINMAWKCDSVSFFDDIYEFLMILFMNYGHVFIEIFDDEFLEFIHDLVESADGYDLMLILPIIYETLNDEQRNDALTILESFIKAKNEFCEGEIFNKEMAYSIPKISLFIKDEVCQNFREFLTKHSLSI
ncbi:hypothetical protein TRFO_20307 [Tritrichomonas foetus]|uniref:Importin N-terminal domain-containing protein n=1 Tax=Tritrichomonas foetus TaxID=1144522 RepID=A0A1J4KG96_9EUKA|nr:hypothetical protein TRFO_20307 [Tritrichomonas foetus]|eukprot:OHT10423.1 hypothetical protein TRFO_20307 [Tritrichomonas foetus]